MTEKKKHAGGVKLTAKQEAFCREYIIDLNAKQAAIRAGYSEKTATEMGYENLSKPHIAELVAELAGEKCKKAEIDADYVLNGIKAIAEGADEARANDKLKAYELLGKHLALFTDKVDHTTKGESIKSISPHEFVSTRNEGE